VVELEAVKLVLQLADFFAVHSHLGVVVALLLHNLVDDKLRVTPDVKPLDPQLNGNAQSIDERLIFSHIVRGQEMKANHVLHTHSMRGDED
jgi:hypothetical protein